MKVTKEGGELPAITHGPGVSGGSYSLGIGGPRGRAGLVHTSQHLALAWLWGAQVGAPGPSPGEPLEAGGAGRPGPGAHSAPRGDGCPFPSPSPPDDGPAARRPSARGWGPATRVRRARTGRGSSSLLPPRPARRSGPSQHPLAPSCLGSLPSGASPGRPGLPYVPAFIGLRNGRIWREKGRGAARPARTPRREPHLALSLEMGALGWRGRFRGLAQRAHTSARPYSTDRDRGAPYGSDSLRPAGSGEQPPSGAGPGASSAPLGAAHPGARPLVPTRRSARPIGPAGAGTSLLGSGPALDKPGMSNICSGGGARRGARLPPGGGERACAWRSRPSVLGRKRLRPLGLHRSLSGSRRGSSFQGTVLAAPPCRRSARSRPQPSRSPRPLNR